MSSDQSSESGAPVGKSGGRRGLAWLGRLHWRWRVGREAFATRCLNFTVQRVLGQNSDCPWPVHFTSRVAMPGNIRLHPTAKLSFALSGGCYVQAGNGIEIGEGAIFAPGVKLISANHDPSDLSRYLPAPPIRIGRFCWIGANAVVLPGVELGDHAVVGAGSVVTKPVPSHAVVAGVPARVLRKLPPTNPAPESPRRKPRVP